MTALINGTTGITFNDASVQNTAATGFGFKNRIINGDMRIDQRNNGAAVTVSSGEDKYPVDRFFVANRCDAVLTGQQTTASNPVGFSSVLGVTVTTADTSLSASQYAAVRHSIEGFNVADLAWGTPNASPVTLSFWVRSSLTGTFGGAFVNASFNRSYPFTYSISAANVWEQKTITVAGDATGTWATDNTAGIHLMFSLGAGSTLSGTAGAWGGAWYQSATGATSVVGTNGATFYITGVQLEKGSTATSFDYRPYGTEYQLCQRYYSQGSVVPTYNGNSLSATMPAFNFYGQPMRISPTVTVANGAVGYGFIQGFVAVSAAPISAGTYYLPGAFTATAEL